MSEGLFDSVGRFEDDPLTEQKDIIMVMDVAINFARLEMELAANLQLKILNMNDFCYNKTSWTDDVKR